MIQRYIDLLFTNLLTLCLLTERSTRSFQCSFCHKLCSGIVFVLFLGFIADGGCVCVTFYSGIEGSLSIDALRISVRRGHSQAEGVTSESRPVTYFWSLVGHRHTVYCFIVAIIIILIIRKTQKQQQHKSNNKQEMVDNDKALSALIVVRNKTQNTGWS